MEKDIMLCGLGNGLVDVQFQISEQEFEQFGIPKGTMHLLSAEQQNAYMQLLKNSASHRSSGGSVANTIIAFAQLGGKAAFKTVVGNDDFGRYYEQEFQELGIELSAEKISDAATGTCLVLITPDAERTLLTSLGINSAFGVEHINEKVVAQSQWLYIEGYKFSEPSGAEAVREALHFAKKHGTKIAVSFSDSFIVNYFHTSLEEVVASSDLIFCNESEAVAYTGIANPRDAFNHLRAHIPGVAMTRGGEGAYVQYGNESYDIAAYETTPIDATGAGDMFAAGFFHGITHGYRPDTAARLGSFAASKIVAQFGARYQSGLPLVKHEFMTLDNA